MLLVAGTRTGNEKCNCCCILSLLPKIDRLKLLDEIIDCGKVNAIIVKVAGAGLDPTKHLGQSLQTLRPSLLR